MLTCLVGCPATSDVQRSQTSKQSDRSASAQAPQEEDVPATPALPPQIRHADALAQKMSAQVAANTLRGMGCKLKERKGEIVLADIRGFDPDMTMQLAIAAGSLPNLERLIAERVNDGPLHLLAGNASFQNLTLVGENNISDDGVIAITRCPNLRTLTIQGSPISDAALQTISQHANLRQLSLPRSNQLTDQGIATLSPLTSQLELLDLVGCEGLTPTAMQTVGQFDGLKVLKLSGGMTTDDSIAVLASLPNLQSLNLQNAAITDAAGESIARASSIRELNLFESPVTDGVLPSLSALPNLKRLVLRGTKITGDAFEAISTFPALEALEVSQTDFSNRGIPALTKCPKLIDINIWQTKINNDAVATLTSIRGVQRLNLDNNPSITDQVINDVLKFDDLRFLHLGKTGVTDQVLVDLPKLRSLSELHINDTQVTQQGIEKLRAVMPQLKKLVTN